MKHLTLLFEAVKPNFPCMHRKTNRVRCNPKNIHDKQSKFKELNLKGDTFCAASICFDSPINFHHTKLIFLISFCALFTISTHSIILINFKTKYKLDHLKNWYNILWIKLNPSHHFKHLFKALLDYNHIHESLQLKWDNKRRFIQKRS